MPTVRATAACRLSSDCVVNTLVRMETKQLNDVNTVLELQNSDSTTTTVMQNKQYHKSHSLTGPGGCRATRLPLPRAAVSGGAATSPRHNTNTPKHAVTTVPYHTQGASALRPHGISADTFTRTLCNSRSCTTPVLLLFLTSTVTHTDGVYGSDTTATALSLP